VPLELVLIAGFEAKTAAACGHIPVKLYQLADNLKAVSIPVGRLLASIDLYILQASQTIIRIIRRHGQGQNGSIAIENHTSNPARRVPERVFKSSKNRDVFA
jgi:hypothetical protein